ncbi:MAG: altronate dehydratase family protein [Woeseiaceae bacterium]
MSMNDKVLQLHPDDNVAVALKDLCKGGTLFDAGPVLAVDIPVAHKIAVADIARGDTVRKFGQVIGVASEDIRAGSHVHVHNVIARFSPAEAATRANRVAETAQSSSRTFDGFVRTNGSVGTRNYIGVVSTVNCSATVVRRIVDRFDDEELQEFANVDGIVPITHTTGCGMASGGAGLEVLQRTLGGFMRHPNFGGILLIGLGCEVNDAGKLLQSQGLATGATLKTIGIQEAGGTRSAIDAGVVAVRELLAIANRATRSPLPVSHIKLGLQCGGSDAFSAISANPALGFAADMLVQGGGTAILAETPEIHGAESLLFDRAASQDVVDSLKERLAWWQQYVALHGSSLNNNPSPGNIAGGITTIHEKSLGAVAKSGTSPLRGVYQYGQTIDRNGFVFMDSPGYDPCSVTGEIAAGANMVCFTTGRGSVFGAKPVPSIKIATNSAMAARMADDMDYDCGSILSGGKSLQEAGTDLFELIVEVAGGRKSASELNGLGDFEFVPWQIGAVL